MVKAFLLMTLVSFGATAATTLPVYRAVSYLHWQDDKGKDQKASLHVEDKTVRVNAVEIPRANWKKGQAAIKSLTNTKASDKKACTAGKPYTLKVTKGNKKSTTEKGCTDSARFKELEKSFSTLQQLLPK